MSEVEPITTVLPAGRISSASEHGGLDEAVADSPIGDPEFVVQPESVEEVAELLRWASAEGVGVLPACSGRHVLSLVRASRSSAMGRALHRPAFRVSRSTKRRDLTVTAGAGTPMSVVDAALRENRQWAPFDPPHLLARSLGGLAADAAHGPLWMGYGELRNHVLGMTVVTGDGRILRLGGTCGEERGRIRPAEADDGESWFALGDHVGHDSGFPGARGGSSPLAFGVFGGRAVRRRLASGGRRRYSRSRALLTGSAPQGTAGAAEARMFVRLHGALVDRRRRSTHARGPSRDGRWTGSRRRTGALF